MAMTLELNVTPNDLRTAASEFEGVFSQLSNNLDQMRSLVTQTNSVWEGEAANAYRSKFDRLNGDMDQAKRMIREHIEDLRAMADRYDAAEEENSADSASLKDDVIS